MNKEAIIREHASPKLLRELEERLEIALFERWGGLYTLVENFEHLSEMSDFDEWKEFRTPCRKVHIALGEYVEMSQEEIDNTLILGWNKNPWAFKLGGKAYKWFEE